MRAAEVLRRVPWVAAEDTRHSAPCCATWVHWRACCRPTSTTRKAAAQQVIERLAAGDPVALISDAGTPAVSDPGARIVARVREAGYRVVPLPGPCARRGALGLRSWRTALVVPRVPAGEVTAARGDAARSRGASLCPRVLRGAASNPRNDIGAAETLGPARRIVIAREADQALRDHPCLPARRCAGLAGIRCQPAGGEFVLIVDTPEAEDGDDVEAGRVLQLLLDDGLPVKQAANWPMRSRARRRMRSMSGRWRCG